MRKTVLVAAVTAAVTAGLIVAGPSIAAQVVKFAQRAGFAKRAGNADKVNGIRASKKPRAGRLFPLGANRKFPASVLPLTQGPPGSAGPTGPRGPTGTVDTSNFYNKAQSDARFAHAYKSTVVVGPVGTAVQNGNALLAAVGGISASSSHPYLVKVEPGTYDLGTSSLSMKEYVDLEGSGERITSIVGQGSPSATTGTVVGANNSELRNLTVSTDGTGKQFAKAVYYGTPAYAGHLLHVTATASDATGTGCGVCGGVNLDHVDAQAYGSATNYGVRADGAPVLMNDSYASAGVGTSYGVYASEASVNVARSVMNANPGATANGYGLYTVPSGNSYGSFVRDSNVYGMQASISNGAGTAMHVVGSLIANGVTGSGFTCLFSFDGSFAALNGSCA